MNTTTFEIRYGRFESYKVVHTTDFEQALRMFDKYKRFAEKHGITWVFSLFDKMENGKYWLIKSTTVNPTAIIH